MADQAKMSTNGGIEGVLESVTDFGDNLAGLAELQAKLAAIDLKECAHRALIPMGVFFLGLTTIGASFVILLLGAAAYLVLSYKMSYAAALALTGAAALLTALVGIGFGIKGIADSLRSFERSREELSRNVQWIRTVLLLSGRKVQRRV